MNLNETPSQQQAPAPDPAKPWLTRKVRDASQAPVRARQAVRTTKADQHTGPPSRTPRFHSGHGSKSRTQSDVATVFAYYREKIQPKARQLPAADEKIRMRLKTFSVSDLKSGIDHFAADAWWMRTNAHRGAVWFFKSDDRSEQFLLLEPRATEDDERSRGNGAARKSSPDDYLRSSLDQVRVMDFNTDDPSEPMKMTDAWGNVIDG